MARRRINTKFLGILAMVMVAIGVGVVLVQKMAVTEHPEPYIEAGNEAASEKKWDVAVAKYGRAVHLSPNDAALRFKYGVALHELSLTDPNYAHQDQAAFERVLEIDPNFKPALWQLLLLTEQQAQTTPLARVFDREKTLATKLHAMDPENHDYEERMYLGTLQGWLAGIDTDPDQIDDAVSHLRKLMERDPSNARIPLFLGETKVKQGAELTSRGDAEGGQALFAEADAIFHDALKTQDANPSMHFNFGQMYGFMALCIPADQDRHSCLVKADKEVRRAQELIKPDDAQYAQVNLAASQLAEQLGDMPRARKLLRDLNANRPDDPQVRLRLAQSLPLNTSDGLREAIAILSRPTGGGASSGASSGAVDGAGQAGAGPSQAGLPVESEIMLAMMQLDLYDVSGDPSEKRSLMDDAQREFAELSHMTADSLSSEEQRHVQMIKGNIELAQNDAVAAIQTLSDAYESAGKEYNPDGSEKQDFQLMNELARAYHFGGQDGKAKELCNEILSKVPDFTPARRLLLEILLAENDMDDARPNVEYLKKQNPNDPSLAPLRVLIDKSSNPDAAKKDYAALPESTLDQIVRKASLAETLGDRDDEARLYQMALQQRPGDSVLTQRLVRALILTKHLDQARDAITAALKANPDDDQLQLYQQRLTDPSPAKIIALRRKQIDKMTDPFKREMASAELEGEAGHPDLQIQHLKAAQALHPDDNAVAGDLFSTALERKDWDEAAFYLDQLRQNNADQAGGLLYEENLDIAKGDMAAAEAVGRRLVSERSQFAVSYISLGRVYLLTGRYDDAMAQFASALDKQNDSLPALQGMAQACDQLHHNDEALGYVETALRLHSDDPQVLDMAVDYYLRYGKPEKAAPILQSIVDQAPDDLQHTALLARADLEEAQKQFQPDGNKDDGQKSFDAGRAVLAQAIARWPDESVFYSLLANSSLLSGNVDDGETALRALAARPAWKGKPDPAILLGRYFVQGNRLDKAETAYRGALSVAPKNVDALMGLADVLQKRNKFDDALALTSTLPDDPRLRRKRIDVETAAGRFPDAVKDIQSLLSENPKDASSLYAFWSQIDLNQGNFESAYDHASKALESDPLNQTAMLDQARALLSEKPPKLDDAMQVLTTLRDAAPDSPDVRQTLSQAYLMKGDLESAIRETELAVRASPHNHELRLRLLRLYGADNPPRVADALACVAEVSASPEYSGDVEFLNASAMLHLAHGDYAQAVADNAAARKLAPSNGQLVKNLMDILYQSKDYQTLVDAATQYIQNQSTREWWLYHSRGLGRKNLGDLEGARADLLEALNVATDQHDDEAATAVVQSIAREIGVDAAIANVVGRFQGDAKWQLALVYLYNAKGDTADAQPLIERILADPGRLSPQEHIIALKVADTVYIEARPRPLYQKAYAVEAALLALRPDDLPTLNNIATHLAEDVQPPRPDKALQYAQHAVDVMQQSGQTDPSITDTYGWVQILDGKPQDGVETLRPLVEAKPFAEASYHLGEGYMRMSYPDEAQRLASQAADELAEDLSQRGWIDPTLKTRIDDLKLRADAAVKAKADAAAPQ